MESGYTYPERSDAQSYVKSEVSRSHSKPATSSVKTGRSHKDEGLNVRKAKKLKSLWQKLQQPKHISELPMRG